MRKAHQVPAKPATGEAERRAAGGGRSLDRPLESFDWVVRGAGGGCSAGGTQAAVSGIGGCGVPPPATAVAGPADCQAVRFSPDHLLDELLHGVGWDPTCAFENMSAAHTASPGSSDAEEETGGFAETEGQAGVAATLPAEPPSHTSRQPPCQPPSQPPCGARRQPPCEPPRLPAAQPIGNDDWLINRQSSRAKYDGGEGSHRRADLAKLNSSEGEDGFASDLVAAFGHLLWRPLGVVRQMRPCGAPPDVGDGIVCLPTLVHRGPGGNDDLARERKVLFFSVKPIYAGFHCADGDVGEYDAEAQIHAGWLLWRTSHILIEPEAVLRGYEEIGYSLLDFGKGEKLRYQDGVDRKKRKRAKDSPKTPAALPAAGLGGGKAIRRLKVITTDEHVPADALLVGASAGASRDGAPATDERVQGLGPTLDDVRVAATMPLQPAGERFSA
jgi:hypothetical protein